MDIRRGAAALIVLVVLAACTPGASPSVTPTPTPTHWCTPPATPGIAQGSPYPCRDYQASWNAEQLAREAEAIEVYTRFFNEYVRVEAMGGVSEPTPALIETTDGGFYELIMKGFRTQKSEGGMARGETPRLKVAIDRTRRVAGSEVTVTACEDSTGLFYYSKEGVQTSAGGLAVNTAFLRRVEGRLKIFNNTFEQGASCPFE